MSDEDPRGERLWEVGWQGHTTAQQRRLAALSLAEKLRWLEEAQQVVMHLNAGRRAAQEERGG
ncbi:MAG: hypothetical protein ABIS67_07420 [Candidatus Eisenbacteria bacterium]